MLKLVCAFDLIKYARYNSFQQVFGVTAAKPTDLHKAFSYPITSLPLSIASPDSSLYQSDKAGFRNYGYEIIKPSIFLLFPECEIDQ